jgi:peptide/nickel transport system substrate-binding protein
VIWSFQILGTEGHLRYRNFHSQISAITQTGPRSLRIGFAQPNREAPLIAGLRPILKKPDSPQDFNSGALDQMPMGTGPYQLDSFEAGRFVALRRVPQYWGQSLPLRRGTNNLDQIRIEFFADQSVLFEAFKAGILNFYREDNAEKWATQYAFPAVQRGDVVLSEIAHQRPSGMTGFVMNTRRPKLSDWRVRQALIYAFNFTYINEAITGGRQPRITSYFSNSDLAMRPGPATGEVAALLAPFADILPPGAIEGYTLPQGERAPRNRADLRQAVALLAQAGWQVRAGVLVNGQGQPFEIELLLRQGDNQSEAIAEIWRNALERLGISLVVRSVDNAQFTQREASQDFDMMPFRRDLSLSPGTEQRLYWGSAGAQQEGTRNVMGVESPAIDALIDVMVTTDDSATFTAAVRALDRVLMAGRYVIPFWATRTDRVAHARALKFPAKTPIYGDRIGWMPDVWWHAADEN